MPKISVIIPVYNVEQYISRCFESILKQTFQDFEVICIYDESNDNTLKILNIYAEKDNRFKIFDNKKRGISTARNYGIEMATGEYIQFVDGDDWIEPQCLEIAYNKISETNADIVFYCYNHLMHGNIISDNLEMSELYLKTHNKKFLIEFMWTCWNKIIKKSFITENEIKFKKEVFFGEDGVFNLMCLYKFPKTECISKVLYNHTLFNPESANCRYNGLEEESSTLKKLINFEEFINTDNDMKIISINRFCAGILSYYNIALKEKRHINKNKLINVIKEIEQKIDKNILKSCHSYIELKSAINKSLIKNLFSKPKLE